MAPISEVARFTRDVAGVARCYAALLGAGPRFQSDSLAVFAAGPAQLLIHAAVPPLPGGPPNEDHIALCAPDLDAACAQLARAGLAPLLAPADYPWGRAAYLRDPDGRLVELQQGGPGVARRVLLLVAELHRRGYQRLRIWPGEAPNGLHWRCTISAAGAPGLTPARFTTGQGAACFGWDDAALAAPADLADMLVARMPELAEAGRGADWAYAGWFMELLRLTDPDGLPVAYGDFDMPAGVWIMAGGSRASIPAPPA